MEGSWSLITFTILGQAAAGMMMLLPFLCPAAEAKKQAWLATIMLIIGAFASLAHLSDPMLSILTITNVASSWISREIAALGAFGFATLLVAITGAGILQWLAAVLGLAFVVVMGNVYMIPAVPFWHTQLTVAAFISTALLLGASTSLAVRIAVNRTSPAAVNGIMLGKYPIILMAALAFRLALVPLQVVKQNPASYCDYGIATHIILSFLGAGLGTLLLTRMSLRATESTENCACGKAQCSSCCVITVAVVSCLLVWAGEITGRAIFYSGFTWFGM